MGAQTGPVLLIFIIFLPFFDSFSKIPQKPTLSQKVDSLREFFYQVYIILKLILLSKYHHKRLSNKCTNLTRFVDFLDFSPFFDRFSKNSLNPSLCQKVDTFRVFFLQVCTILKLLLLSKCNHKWLSNECTNWTHFVNFFHFSPILTVFEHFLSCLLGYL